MIRFCRYDIKDFPGNHYQLRPLGIFLDFLRLLDTDALNEPYVTFHIWIDRVRQRFCKHQYEYLWKLPDTSRGERGYPDMCGMLRSGERMCKKCYHVRGMI